MALLATRTAVDELAEYVRVPGVTGRLLQQAHQHPAKARRRIRIRPPAGLLKAGPGEDDGVDFLPRPPVEADSVGQRVAPRRLAVTNHGVFPREPAVRWPGCPAGWVDMQIDPDRRPDRIWVVPSEAAPAGELCRPSESKSASAHAKANGSFRKSLMN